MYPDTLSDEARYRYEERLGMLCGSAEPTPEQRKIADDERAEFLRLNDPSSATADPKL